MTMSFRIGLRDRPEDAHSSDVHNGINPKYV